MRQPDDQAPDQIDSVRAHPSALATSRKAGGRLPILVDADGAVLDGRSRDAQPDTDPDQSDVDRFTDEGNPHCPE